MGRSAQLLIFHAFSGGAVLPKMDVSASLTLSARLVCGNSPNSLTGKGVNEVFKLK